MKKFIANISRITVTYSKFLIMIMVLSSSGTPARADDAFTYLKCGTSYLKLSGLNLYTTYNIRTKKFMKYYLSKFEIFNWQNIYLIEEKIAESLYSKVQKRNPYLLNNKYDIDIIDCNFKELEYKNMCLYFGINTDIINIENPNNIKMLNKMWKCITIRNWINYFIWIYIKNYGIYISEESEQILFDFYGKKLK